MSEHLFFPSLRPLALAVASGVVAMTGTAADCRAVVPLADWRFSRDGETWSDVRVPHDWAIAGPFDKEIDKQTVAVVQDGEKVATEKTGRTGALPWIGRGVYRREVRFPENCGWAAFEFQGAMSEPEVFLDGRKIGEWKLGYATFLVEVPGDLRNGVRRLEVRLNNRPLSSRWYPGAGLFRSVRLLTGGAVGVRPWGQTIVTPTLTNVVVTTELRGEGKVAYRVLDADGRTMAQRAAGEPTAAFSIPGAREWSPESPVLYTLVTEVTVGSKTVELRRDRFGFRTIDFSDGSFRLNGVRRKFRGVCLHHDLGPLGAAFSKDGFRRQVRLLKEMGADSIRTSHNPPCPDQLEVCDEEGMMVMAESFDMWRDPKCKNGYALFYDEWWRRDLTNLIEANRNHPSVVLWSIGNEVPEQSQPGGRDMAAAMQDLCHRLDPSRPVTQGLDRVDDAIRGGMLQVMDVPGLNYRLPRYEAAWKATPKRFILGAETASTVSSRATYHFPVEPGKGVTRSDGHCSGYDVECCPWSNLPDDDWAMQDDHAWTVGEFVWTGFDYLGEPTPYNEYWPSRSSYFGIFDLAGLPKDRYWLYRSRWNKTDRTVHICPAHWNFRGRAGKTVPVYVYTDADEGELFLNGRSLGRRRKDRSSRLDRYRLRWNDVVYEPGELMAVVRYADGTERTDTVRTSGRANAARVTSETYGELTYFRVALVDANGILVPDDDRELSFEIVDGVFKGVCNGDQTSLEPFVRPRMRTFRGELVVVAEGAKARLVVRMDGGGSVTDPVGLPRVELDGRPLKVETARCSAMPVNIRWPGHQRELDQTEICTFVRFDLSRPMALSVTAPADFKRAVIRPLSKHVDFARSGRVVSFTLKEPGAYSVEFDGRHHNLHVFADVPGDYSGIDRRSPAVRYYGPGEHDVGPIELKTGDTLFIDEGATVYGRVFASDADHIRIVGRGILDCSRVKEVPIAIDPALAAEQRKKGWAITNVKRFDAIRLDYCDDVKIEGITIRDAPLYTIRPICSRSFTVENVKIIGNWRYNSDGIDMHNCRKVRIRNCFLRTYDDSICVKGFDYRMNEADMLHDGEMHDVFDDVLVEKCTLWTDWGLALEIGAETRAREISNVVFRDCDVIWHHGSAMNVQHCDQALVHDIVYDGIRVEYDDDMPYTGYVEHASQWDSSRRGCLVDVLSARIAYIPEYSLPNRRGSMRDITFRNIDIFSSRLPGAHFHGFDAEHRIRGIRLENIRLNGEDVTVAFRAKANLNDFAEF